MFSGTTQRWYLVRKGGFEPPRLSAPPPQDGVSASSTTSANPAPRGEKNLTRANSKFKIEATKIITNGLVSAAPGLIVNDRGKRFRVQAGAADEGPINFGFREQSLG